MDQGNRASERERSNYQSHCKGINEEGIELERKAGSRNSLGKSESW